MKRQKPSVLRILLGALKCGSWQLSCEIETERLLFPKAYELRKQKEAKQEEELENWFKRALRQQKRRTKK